MSDLHIEDDLRGDIGLTFRHIDGCLPFIRLPRNTSLNSIGHCGLDNIYTALRACENLHSPLCRSNKKCVLTDFGKRWTSGIQEQPEGSGSSLVHGPTSNSPLEVFVMANAQG